MHTFVRRLALGASLLGLFAGSASSVLASSPNPIVGHVYVDNNSAVHNSVAGFDRHLDGTLTPLAGSPFATGGAGTGVPIGSAGAIQFSADGRYVLAVDPASNDISVLRIRADGCASTSSARESLARHDARSALPSMASWSMSPMPVPVAATTPASGSSAVICSRSGARRSPCPTAPRPGQILFSGDGRTLVGDPGWTERRTLVHRQLPGRLPRPADPGTEFPDPGPADRPVRERLPANQPEPAVRLERP